MRTSKLKPLAAAIVLTASLNGFMYSAQAESEMKPYIDSNNRTMVPIRFISEQLGAKVDWNGATREISIVHNGTKITLAIGDDQAIVNEKPIKLDTQAVIQQGATFVPIRLISEALGAATKWIPEKQQISIMLQGKSIVLEVPRRTVESSTLTEQQIRGIVKAYEKTESVIFKSIENVNMPTEDYYNHELFAKKGKGIAAPLLQGIASKRFIQSDLEGYLQRWSGSMGESGMFSKVSFDARMQIMENTKNKVVVKTFQLQDEAYRSSQSVYVTFVKENGKWVFDREQVLDVSEEPLKLAKEEVQKYIKDILDWNVQFVAESTVMYSPEYNKPKKPVKAYFFYNREYDQVMGYTATTGEMVWEAPENVKKMAQKLK